MSNWLTAVSDVLNRKEKPVRLFFRDDDAGWADDKLCLLLDVFAKAAMPIDIAIIPDALNESLANELLARWRQKPQFIGLHQHGFSHTNHEPIGRKCEFGSTRAKDAQKNDIQQGQCRLKAALGIALDPFFTPPWNRCTQLTVECLEELNFSLLSRDITATNLHSSSLQQVPVHIDWSKFIKTSVNALSDLGQTIARNLEINNLTGIMLHHADMNAENLKSLTELLALCAAHHNVQGLLLRDTLG